jgi:hypothetical protein
MKSGYLDQQMDTIKFLLRDHVNEISRAQEPQAAIVYKMYEIATEYLENILHYNWMGSDSKLALIGGIMINCDGEGTDQFVPLSFEIRSNKGQTKVDVFEDCFGVASTIVKKKNASWGFGFS